MGNLAHSSTKATEIRPQRLEGCGLGVRKGQCQGFRLLRAGDVITASKTDAMYFPTGMGSFEDGDTTPFMVPGPGGEDPGFWSTTKKFKY